MTKSERKERAARAVHEVETELRDAVSRHERFNSCHEAWAVLYEEVDELWEEVRRKPSARSKAAMRIEAKQVAAMAIRFMAELCDDDEETEPK